LNASSHSSSSGKGLCEWLAIVGFVVLIWLPTFDHFLKLDHARAAVENRFPAKWPKFGGWRQCQDYLAGVEKYFNDHFGFRKRLIRWNSHWKGRLFASDSGQDVMVGKDGWLFFTGGRMMDHVTRAVTWSEQDLENWKRLLEARRDWLQARGIKYLFVLPPDKHSVYPEYLPAWLAKSDKPSKVEQLLAYMKSHSTVQVLDLHPALLEAKTIRPVFLNTDTHWNHFGGYAGYRATVQALGDQFPEIKPLPFDAYDWQPVTNAPSGDLAANFARTEVYQEREAFTPVPKMQLPPVQFGFDEVRLPHPKEMPQLNWPCFTLNPAMTRKAVVFHDSYLPSWYPFLGLHFKEVIYLWHYDWDRPVIEREKPDVVIDEIVERNLVNLDPIELRRKDEASDYNSRYCNPKAKVQTVQVAK